MIGWSATRLHCQEPVCEAARAVNLPNLPSRLPPNSGQREVGSQLRENARTLKAVWALHCWVESSKRNHSTFLLVQAEAYDIVVSFSSPLSQYISHIEAYNSVVSIFFSIIPYIILLTLRLTRGHQVACLPRLCWVQSFFFHEFCRVDKSMTGCPLRVTKAKMRNSNPKSSPSSSRLLSCYVTRRVQGPK